MSEPSEIRLVRCPRCENLLPELKDYLVYRCGGCGAVLGAKIEKLEADTLSQKSDEERVRGGSDKFPEELDKNSFSEKGMSQTDGSKSDVKFNGHYSRRADKMVLLGNTVDHQRDGSSTKFDRCGVGFVDTELEANSNLNESSRVEGGPPNGISNGFQKSGRVADWRSEEGDEIEGFQRNPTRDFHGVKYSNPMYPEDGPWNYKLMSSYGFGEALQNNQNKSHEFNKVEYLEQDRAELLRKLDELKDQLTQSCNVKEKPKKKFPHDQRWVHNEEPYGSFESQFRDSSWGSNRGPHYVRHYPEPSPYKIRQEMEMHSFCPSMHAPNQAQRFGDPIRSQVPRRGPLQAPSAHRQQSSHPYFSGQYQYRDMDPFEPYPPNMNFHHPSCSCLRCYSQQRVPAPVPPAAAFHNRMAPNAQNDLMFYHSENPSAFGPRYHNPRIGNPPPLNSTNLQSNTTWPSNLNSEADGFVHCRPHRGVLATHGRHCHPLAGGAPFVTCYNCLELLLLPKKMLLVEKNQKKVRCGGCSAVILSTVVDNKLVVSVQSMTGRTPNIIGDSPIAAIGGCTLHSRVHANPRANFSSGDYDDSVYDFQSMNREVVSSSNGYKSGVGSVHSTSAYSSEAEGSIINLNAQVEESNSVGPVEESNLSPPAAGSPLQDHFDYSTQYRVVNRLGKGSQSGHSEREKIEDPKKVTSRQNSMKDVSLETEMDVSFSEYSNTGTSQDSGDTSREEQARGNKGGQSFFAGIMKKSFKDSTKSNQSIEQSSRNVTVNGHLMSDRLLKKAEKLSGPIQSGQYWYDSRAGFWGVMGGPCLGIIPPFIEEFNSPMPENCAGGNTSVFVNGRELNLRDLNLLSSRGLPTTRDRSYIIEISGRVLDEDSGEELDSLGKLAPTIEKVKHGFGMKVPRVAA